MFKPTRIKRTIFFIFFDIVISFLTLFFAYNLRFNFDVPQEFFNNFIIVFMTITLLKILTMYYFKIYKVSWRFFSLSEVKKLLDAHIAAYLLFVIVYYIFPDSFSPFSRSVLLIDLFLSMMFIGFFRILKRLVIEGGHDVSLKKTLLIGASPYAQTLFKQKNDFYISAVVDDSNMMVGSYFSNIHVRKMDDIEKIVKEESIESVIITKELEQTTLKELYSRLNLLNIHDIKLATLSKKEATLKNITVEDLLARHPKDLDKKAITSFIKNKVVLITGAGGSIGSEISRQCVEFGAKELILLDNSEFNLYSITDTLKGANIHSIMQSVLDVNRLEKVFVQYKPDIVIHAAAYKHVPLCEENISMAIENNVLGTKNCIDVSIKYGVDKFVMISTDKAVRPTNVMGTTKRICELYAQNVVPLENDISNKDANNTEIVAVRFGNVLGSSGSVIPKFKSQIERGENLTVTHPEITRYFMLIPEACELVLQAASLAKGGEIFILDMGEPIKIADLANKMIELSGKENISIEFTGLRPGEKLYEELLIDESDVSTEYESITAAKATKYDIEKLNFDIEELLNTEDKLSKLKEIVPEFNHQMNIDTTATLKK